MIRVSYDDGYCTRTANLENADHYEIDSQGIVNIFKGSSCVASFNSGVWREVHEVPADSSK